MSFLKGSIILCPLAYLRFATFSTTLSPSFPERSISLPYQSPYLFYLSFSEIYFSNSWSLPSLHKLVLNVAYLSAESQHGLRRKTLVSSCSIPSSMGPKLAWRGCASHMATLPWSVTPRANWPFPLQPVALQLWNWRSPEYGWVEVQSVPLYVHDKHWGPYTAI